MNKDLILAIEALEKKMVSAKRLCLMLLKSL